MYTLSQHFEIYKKETVVNVNKIQKSSLYCVP